MTEEIKLGDIVTYEVAKNASNTFIVDSIIDDIVFLRHPLNEDCVLKVSYCDLNEAAPVLKDDMERCLDYAKKNTDYLDFNSKGDLESICLYFVYKRQLTAKQKNTLSNICGLITSIKFSNDVQEAMKFIVSNEGVLDDYNQMWYNNFQGLFNGKQPITSKKQRASIFNIAGFVAAQLENPSAAK